MASCWSCCGVQFCRAHKAAAFPAAWPSTAQVAITRVLPKATCVALMLRPATSRFVTFRE